MTKKDLIAFLKTYGLPGLVALFVMLVALGVWFDALG